MDSNNTAYTKTFSIDLERTNYHLKMKKRKLKRIIIVIVLWILLIIYFIAPLSRLNLKVTGNVYYSKEELANIGYINEDSFWWLFNSDNATKTLESYEYIDKVEIKKSLFGTKMKINEVYPLGEKNDLFVLNNGKMIDKNLYPNKEKISNITKLDNIEERDLEYLLSKYSNVDIGIRNHFTKLEIVRNSDDFRFIKIHGYDDKIGFYIIKTELVYLDTKFNENKYDKIIEEINKNKLKYGEDKPALIAYHEINEDEFHLVDSFKEE